MHALSLTTKIGSFLEKMKSRKNGKKPFVIRTGHLKEDRKTIEFNSLELAFCS